MECEKCQNTGRIILLQSTQKCECGQNSEYNPPGSNGITKGELFERLAAFPDSARIEFSDSGSRDLSLFDINMNKFNELLGFQVPDPKDCTVITLYLE